MITERKITEPGYPTREMCHREYRNSPATDYTTLTKARFSSLPLWVFSKMYKDNNDAHNEIHKTLGLCNFCTRKVGLSFIDEAPRNMLCKIAVNLWLIISTIVLFLMVAGEIDYVASKLVTSSSVVEFVSSLHIVGYDTMSNLFRKNFMKLFAWSESLLPNINNAYYNINGYSRAISVLCLLLIDREQKSKFIIVTNSLLGFGKLLTIWYKRNVFKILLKDLEDIWTITEQDKEAAVIKQERLSSLRIVQFCYAFWNILGVWLYNLTPIVVSLYKKIQGKSAYLGYIWQLCYPFDKTKPGYHEFAFVFEAYGGVVSVWCMLGSDMLFMTMANHISMLLRILQVKIRRLGVVQSGTNGKSTSAEMQDCYDEIVSVIKIHQRLIRYGNDLEDAFSVVNLINVLLSSVNICCVVFNILLDPWMAMSNKFFLGAAMTQVGILCWYADDIYRASLGVGDAVYESGWFNTNIRCRRTLLVLIQRSQKPLYFTALKFRSITMSTYSSILTTSYSYFTLLYTMYRGD